MTHTPFQFHEAVQSKDEAAAAMKSAERFRQQCAKTRANAEMLYRVALARRIVELHADGVAWTVCQDLARGDEKVALLRYERDVAEGTCDAAEVATWRLTADRKDLNELIRWSARVDLQMKEAA